MANRFSDRADFDIPESLIDEHEWMTDALIDGPTGQVCQLIYPQTTITECPNCIFDQSTGMSSNIYKDGGPYPFTNHTVCPMCNGIGRSSAEVTEDIRLRVYWQKSDWQKILGKEVFQDPRNYVMVIGYMTDLPKLEQANRVLVDSQVGAYRHWICERDGESSPWGFRHNRYFIQFLRRTGG